jgi:hypothetical protein
LTEEKIIEIGTVKHFFSKINVAIIALNGKLSVGDSVLIKGPSTDFEMKVDSMQIEHKNIQSAESVEVGIKIPGHAKERDVVYRKL